MRSQYLTTSVVLFFLFLVQNFFSFILPIRVPAFLLVGVIFYALFEGPWFGFFLGLLSGLLLELFGIGKMGCLILSFGFVGSLSGFLASKIFRDSWLTQILSPIFFAYVLNILNLLMDRIYFGEGPVGLAILKDAFSFFDFLFLAVLSPVLFFVLKRISYKKLVLLENRR